MVMLRGSGTGSFHQPPGMDTAVERALDQVLRGPVAEEFAGFDCWAFYYFFYFFTHVGYPRSVDCTGRALPS